MAERTWTTLAVGGGKIYWAGGDSDKIYRENLDGTGQEVLVSGLSRPMGIALNLVNNRYIGARKAIKGSGERISMVPE